VNPVVRQHALRKVSAADDVLSYGAAGAGAGGAVTGGLAAAPHLQPSDADVFRARSMRRLAEEMSPEDLRALGQRAKQIRSVDLLGQWIAKPWESIDPATMTPAHYEEATLRAAHRARLADSVPKILRRSALGALGVGAVGAGLGLARR